MRWRRRDPANRVGGGAGNILIFRIGSYIALSHVDSDSKNWKSTGCCSFKFNSKENISSPSTAIPSLHCGIDISVGFETVANAVKSVRLSWNDTATAFMAQKRE